MTPDEVSYENLNLRIIKLERAVAEIHNILRNMRIVFGDVYLKPKSKDKENAAA